MVSLLLSVATSVAGVLMGAAHFPQAYRIWKRKSSKDVSILMYSLFFVGAWLWLIYGLAIHDLPLIVSFSVSVFAITLAFALVLRYR